MLGIYWNDTVNMQQVNWKKSSCVLKFHPRRKKNIRREQKVLTNTDFLNQQTVTLKLLMWSGFCQCQFLSCKKNNMSCFSAAALLCRDEQDSGMSFELLSSVWQQWHHLSKRMFPVHLQTVSPQRQISIYISYFYL